MIKLGDSTTDYIIQFAEPDERLEQNYHPSGLTLNIVVLLSMST